jgi:hypothetical protein
MTFAINVKNVLYILVILYYPHVDQVYAFAFSTGIRQEIVREKSMTFIEFKKTLLDAEITLPKFCKLIKVSDKNIQSYKKKGDVPNTIAVIVTCFAKMNHENIDYRSTIEQLQLKKQTKSGGFKKKTTRKEPAKEMKQEPTET